MSPRHLRRLLAAGTGLATAAVVTGCTTQPSPEVAVRTFLLNWQAGEYAAAAQQTNGDPDEVAEALEDTHRQLDLAGLRFSLGKIQQDGDTATAAFEGQADLGIGDPVWNFDGSMNLQRGAQGWAIDWSPSVIHPELGANERIAVSYDVPDRGQILDRNDEPLVGTDAVTAFGVVPAEMRDMERGVADLAELLGEDSDPLLDRVRSAPPQEFQPLVLMRQGDVRADVERRAKEIPGVRTEKLEMRLNPRAAEAVIGQVAGTAEHNVSSRVAGTYQAGDTVGLTGLQNVFQQRLAGTATTAVVTVDAEGQETGTLHSWPGMESGSLTTTLDLRAQEAGESALAALPGRGYLVALDARTGEILAAVGNQGGTDDTGALTAEYRPGEAFSIVSATAALESGMRPADTMACENQTRVGDRTFRTPNNTGLSGLPDLTTNFTYACTTAFARMGEQVGAEALESAASRFGIGGDWRLSVPTYNGNFSPPQNQAETAAAMAGVDQVRVSPLSMAMVAGAVADGTWHAPRLVADDDAANVQGGESHELDPQAVGQVQDMMRAVVEQSATAANVGTTLPVHGQVANTQQKVRGQNTAVQWFVGYQGPLAFAVVAEVDPSIQLWEQYAVTAAGSFLQTLPAGYAESLAQDGGSAPDVADTAPQGDAAGQEQAGGTPSAPATGAEVLPE
ncbi:penicillin-binding transpeptidase domain-containing protein [Streptomonospora nanhaiensis]|uniref:Cell division protein FtsI/penicillin-binding protein 2 n=1 Tax=Streptomonospora nanhaiensis TaxID=1323731 RepID=A0A853BN12_9ACTN|nr:penicillin-binding transpeptidase domain-containing protein [Streptomonospora nanhaiensis]MBV2362124.1 cell division protein FtsI [Streptomonospora nanhaiensis]MBV2364804.1 cell division protein FtsI [Streptomonospora nanhaiensis]MBX9388577.1 cell division protein FtsI [Streptomonospora nanhaiensis]NYI96047.1 cell division protein FtsI/penicillin-binding protein 2 [Streptomonospora nanhaiensis]